MTESEQFTYDKNAKLVGGRVYLSHVHLAIAGIDKDAHVKITATPNKIIIEPIKETNPNE